MDAVALPNDSRLEALDDGIVLVAKASSLDTALETVVLDAFFGLKLNMVEKSLSKGLVKVFVGTLISTKTG